MELNPNHPTTNTMRDQWHKIAGILVARSKDKTTTITESEVARMAGQAITIKETSAGIELRVVSMDEGQQLARKEGGLPV